MRDRAHEIEARGAGIAAVGLGGPGAAAAFRDEAGITFPLLLDPRSRAYRAAGLRRGGLLDLLRPFNRAAHARARSAGFRSGGIAGDPFRLGGTFVLGAGDRDRFVHRSRTFGDVTPIESVLAALDDHASR